MTPATKCESGLFPLIYFFTLSISFTSYLSLCLEKESLREKLTEELGDKVPAFSFIPSSFSLIVSTSLIYMVKMFIDAM